MKEFKVGDRVAFSVVGGIERYKGKIEPWEFNSSKVCILYKDQYLSLDACTNIKRLVKKKRLTIWVNDCGNYLSMPFVNEFHAKKRAKQSPTFVRTIKFKECK